MRLSAIFIAACMAIIAVSVGAVLYFRFGFGGFESTVIALAVLTVLALYNGMASRLRDRADVGDQIADLSRGTGDLARQVAELGRRIAAVEGKVDSAVDKALAASRPLADEIGELGGLVKELAETVAAHENLFVLHGRPTPEAAAPEPAEAAFAAVAETVAAAAPARGFGQLDEEEIAHLLRDAIDTNRIELYLQPIVTLPQRKVRFYEAFSRLKTDDGEVVAAADFIDFAESRGLVPRVDELAVFRCVQVVRRLLLKNRDVGLFCNMSAATLSDAGFPQLLEFLDANRAIAPALVFEFTQDAVRELGPIENESLAALADRGFHFSMDHLRDLRFEPREFADRGFRFVKAPAELILDRAGPAASDIHPADLSDLLGRFGIDLIAEKIESESIVVDLLDYDVRYGQGFLFSAPRAVRPEVLQGIADRADSVLREGPSAAAPRAQDPAPAPMPALAARGRG
jgi:cyclic-di-GMP phosphodiesterase TipF (flagellum assembly factor)